MLYRQAKKADIPQIIKIMNDIKERYWSNNLDLWSEDYPSQEIITDDINKGLGMVLEDNNKVVAFLAISLFDEDYLKVFPNSISKIEFARVMVDLNYQSHGYGEYLVNETIKYLTKQGYKDICITVDTFNKVAIHIYEKAGFKCLGKAFLSWGEMYLYYYLMGE